MIKKLCLSVTVTLGFIVCAFPVKQVQAQTCGAEYVIRSGDTLADIAARVYGRASDWTVLLYANQNRLGANASLLVPGLSIKVPCAGEANKPFPEVATTPAQDVTAAAQPSFIVSSTLTKIKFLTADGFAPFADRSLPNGGMITQLLGTAMDLIKVESNKQFDHEMSWVNDWASHLNPLLANRAFDAGYPWVKPDCNNLAILDADAKHRCQKFFFSQPLYEILIHFFVRKDSKLDWSDEQKFLGRNFCRPASYTTYEFDQNGRNWVKDNKITLMRPSGVEECFRLLESGAIDAVVAPDLVGQATVSTMGLTDKVRMTEKPFAINTLHVIVTKNHPQARTILYYINESLSKLRETGNFDPIVEDHLSSFWKTQDGYNYPGEVGKPSPGEAGKQPGSGSPSSTNAVTSTASTNPPIPAKETAAKKGR